MITTLAVLYVGGVMMMAWAWVETAEEDWWAAWSGWVGGLVLVFGWPIALMAHLGAALLRWVSE